MAGPVRVGTELTLASGMIPQTWTPGLKEEATEEMVLVNDFSTAEGVEKIRGKLNIRKIKRQVATALAAGGGTGLVYTQNIESAITCTPFWVYSAVELDRQVYNQMDFSPDSAYRDMIKYAIAEYIDQQGGLLAASLSANVKGSALADIDKGLILDAEQALVVSCRRKFKPGQTPWFLKVAPTQVKNLLSIFDLTADYARGDAEMPLVSGWIVKALGAKLDESGNIYNPPGITHNFAHIPDAFVIGYNEEPLVIPPQDFELVTRLIATAEAGVATVFDNYAVDVQSKG